MDSYGCSAAKKTQKHSLKLTAKAPENGGGEFIARWWFHFFFKNFHPLGKISNLTSILAYFSDGWFNHQLDSVPI